MWRQRVEALANPWLQILQMWRVNLGWIFECTFKKTDYVGDGSIIYSIANVKNW